MSKNFIFAALAVLLLSAAIPAANGAQPASTPVWNVTFQWQGDAAPTNRQNNFNADGTGSDNDNTPFTYSVNGTSISWTYTVFDRCVYTGTINGNTMSGTMSDPTTGHTGTWSAVPASTTYALTIVSGAGGGSYSAGTEVAIAAGAPPAGQAFDHWTGAAVANAYAASTTLAMPAAAATVTANYATAHTLTVANGSGGGSYAPLTVVPIAANAAPAGLGFYYWTGAAVANKYAASTALTMPGDNATVTAFYSQPAYALTVAGGSGGGHYGPNVVVSLAANAPPAGQAFSKWTGAAVADAYAASTTLIMPAAAATVTANYITPPTVTSLTPTTGLLSGGTAVTISGTGFAASGTVRVTFGGQAAGGVAVKNSTTLICTVPAGATAGAVTVAVTNPGGGSGSLSAAYYYYLTPPTVATPVFNPAGILQEWYSSGGLVNITCATSGATIYYTTDGSWPTTKSAQYTGPVNITDSVLLQAVAVKTGWANSLIPSVVFNLTIGRVMWSYTFMDTDGDNVPDELEIALGTDPNDPNSNTFNAVSPVPFHTLTLTNIGIKLSFKVNNSPDTITLSGALPVPAGFIMAKQQVVIDVGGGIKIFNLDSRGNGHAVSGIGAAAAGSSKDRFKLNVKSKKGQVAAQTASFTAQFTCINSVLFDEGFNSDYAATHYPTRPPVIILFNGQMFYTQQSTKYSVKAGK